MFGCQRQFSTLLATVLADIGNGAFDDPLGGVTKSLSQVANSQDLHRLGVGSFQVFTLLDLEGGLQFLFLTGTGNLQDGDDQPNMSSPFSSTRRDTS